MNPFPLHRCLLCLGIAAVLTSAAPAQDSPASTPASANPSTLSPLAFLAAHDWEAKLPDTADGKKMVLRTHCAWSENRQIIRTSSQFVTDGKAKPYVDGLYAWDPRARIIIFIYANASGGLSRGTVKQEGNTLVHEFEEVGKDGSASNFVAKITPQGEKAWENEIFARQGEELTSLVKVRNEQVD
ncbi:MAG: hypothetical protein ABI946_04985 [Chthoniobacterales bacterium]